MKQKTQFTFNFIIALATIFFLIKYPIISDSTAGLYSLEAFIVLVLLLGWIIIDWVFEKPEKL